MSKLSAEEIANLTLSELPAAIRRASDARAREQSSWRLLYENYLHQIRSLTSHYHRDLHLQISAARNEAELNEDVTQQGIASLARRDKVEELRRIEENLKNELAVRLADMRSCEGGPDQRD
jgi:hypothetical protein